MPVYLTAGVPLRSTPADDFIVTLDDNQDKTWFRDTRVVIALRGRDELGLWAAEIAWQVGMNTSGVPRQSIIKVWVAERLERTS